MLRNWRFSAVTTALGIAAASTVTVGGARAKSVVGTLTCTIARVPEDQTVDIRLSCNFAANNDGWQRDYVGTATRHKSARFPSGKHVLVWTVISEDSNRPPTLEGTYRGRTGGTAAGILVGGPGDGTRLESASGSAQVVGPRTLTKLSLRAVPKRA